MATLVIDNQVCIVVVNWIVFLLKFYRILSGQSEPLHRNEQRIQFRRVLPNRGRSAVSAAGRIRVLQPANTENGCPTQTEAWYVASCLLRLENPNITRPSFPKVIRNSARHSHICDYHKNRIQSVRSKKRRHRKDSEDDSNETDTELSTSMPEVDLVQLQMNTLRRYKRHYKVSARQGLNKNQMAEVSGLCYLSCANEELSMKTLRPTDDNGTLQADPNQGEGGAHIFHLHDQSERGSPEKQRDGGHLSKTLLFAFFIHGNRRPEYIHLELRNKIIQDFHLF